jgi:hypothetical protein
MQRILVILFVAAAAFATIYIGFSTIKVAYSNPQPYIVNSPDISELDSGGYFTYGKTGRFWFTLDPATHPLNKMIITCSDENIIEKVPNLSVNGSDKYPVGYKALSPGSCTFKNGDFSILIVVANN